MTSLRLSGLLLLAAVLLPTLAQAQNTPPVIDHAPVKVAVRGQNLLFRAKVTDDSKSVDSVTLFYAVSRDAAPYKVAMNTAGAGVFTGIVSAELTSGLQQLLYYIEAKDSLGAVTETPWHTVEIKAGTTAPTPAPTVKTAPASPEKESSWKKPALIAGGALAAGGVALAVMGGGGGGDSGGGGNSSTNTAGSYSGNASVYFQPAGGIPSGSTYPITITISSKGLVSSDTLLEGTHLEGQLSGANFLLTAPVSEPDRTGEIQFLGVVINNRIAGTVQGSATTSAGSGSYSGTFGAAR